MKLGLRSCPVETSESQMRKLLEFAEWLRKVSGLLIHPGVTKDLGEGHCLPAKGLPSQWILEPFCGSRPTNIIYCEWIPCLGFPRNKRRFAFRMMKWNWHLHRNGASTKLWFSSQTCFSSPATELRKNPPTILCWIAQVRHLEVALVISVAHAPSVT